VATDRRERIGPVKGRKARSSKVRLNGSSWRLERHRRALFSLISLKSQLAGLPFLG
jgi:hypothetical protein